MLLYLGSDDEEGVRSLSVVDKVLDPELSGALDLDGAARLVPKGLELQSRVWKERGRNNQGDLRCRRYGLFKSGKLFSHKLNKINKWAHIIWRTLKLRSR